MTLTDRINRRAALKGLGAACTTALAGCVGMFGGGGGGPIKFGAVVPLSGGLSLVGQEDRRGMELAREHLGGQVLGEDLELVFRDSQTQTSAALQQTRSLVGQENVDALTGIASSANGITVLPYLKNDAQIPQAFCQVSTPAARENAKYCTRYAFYPWPSMRQQALPHVEFVTTELGKHVDADTSKVHFIGLDYEAGQTARDMVEQYLEETGGEMVGATMVPLGTTDLAPYITEVSNSAADVVSGFMPGGNAVRLINQADEFGLPEKKVMCLLGDTTSPLALVAAGESSKGWFGVHWYDFERENQMNQTFKEMYAKQWNDLPPNDLAASGFNCVYSVAQAMEAADSRNPDDVIEAMSGMSFGSPMGELTYRVEDHQTELNMIGYEVVDGPGSGWDWDRKVFQRYDDVIGPAMCSL